jgi:hypothetical protein
VLLGGGYRLDSLVEPTGPWIELVGTPVTLQGSDPSQAVLPLPLGVASGDLLVVEAFGRPSGSMPAGWRIDDSLMTQCADDLVTLHHTLVDADLGNMVDLSSVFSGICAYRIVVSAFRHAGGLGSTLARYLGSVTPEQPYMIDLPLAHAGNHALVALFTPGDTMDSLSISADGVLAGVSSSLYVFDVPLVDPVPTSVSITGHQMSCAFLRVQTLVGAP